MDIAKAVREIRDNAKNFGTGQTARWFALKVINHVIPTRYIVGMTLEKVSPESIKLDPRFHAGLMKAEQLSRFVGSQGWDDPGFGLSHEGLARAEQNGIEWYAITDGAPDQPDAKLASIGWYSCEATVNGGNPVYFSPEWVYMFRGYTHPDYRGFRLHGIGMGRAMLEFQKRGLKGIISDVDGRNLSSLKSVFRLGYKKIGVMYMFEVLGKHLVWTDAGCKQYNFRYAAPVDLPNCTAIGRTAQARPTS